MTTMQLKDAGTMPLEALPVPPVFTERLDAASQRVDNLSPRARELSAIASVFGPTFSIDDAGEVLGEPVGRLLPLVQEIVDAGIVVAEEQAFAFVDDATREAIYARIPEPVRLPLHRQIGSLFLARGGSAVTAATHLASAARLGDRTALAALDRATIEALATNPARSAEFALRAVDLTPLADEHRAERLIMAVNALVAARRLVDAATLAEALLDTANLPMVAATELRLTLSSILLTAGRAGEALGHSEAVLLTANLPQRCYAAAEIEQLLALLAHDNPAAARTPAETILSDPDRPGDDDSFACALTALACIAWEEGRVADALGLLRAAVHRVDLRPLDGRHWDPRVFLAPMLSAVGKIEDAGTCIDDAARELAAQHDTPWTITPAILRARLQLATGAINEAQASAEDALAAAETLDAGSLFAPALTTLASIALLRGDLDAAAEHLARFHADARAPRGFLAPGAYAWAEARLRAQEHDSCRALEMLLPAFDDVAAHKRLFLEEPASAAWLVRIALACGDRWRAAAVVAAVEQLGADNRGFPDVHARAVHARALLDGDIDALRWAAMNQRQPWARASAAEDAAKALAAAGRDDEARDEMERAIGAYEQAGAVSDADRVRRRRNSPTARHGHVRRRNRPVDGWDSLTDGERRVVALVAEGLTNRQVAARAFLSRHTVDFHLRQVFRKLSVCSRVELARLAIEHELTATP